MLYIYLKNNKLTFLDDVLDKICDFLFLRSFFDNTLPSFFLL